VRCVLNSQLAVFCQSSDVYNVSAGFVDDLVRYLQTVIRVEWPTQAEGRPVDRATAYLERLNRTAIGLKLSGVADGNLQAQLLQPLSRLWDARQQRLLAAETTVPAVVWSDFRVSTQPFDQALSQIQAAKVTDR
jgi:hypothetical protein